MWPPPRPPVTYPQPPPPPYSKHPAWSPPPSFSLLDLSIEKLEEFLATIKKEETTIPDFRTERKKQLAKDRRAELEAILLQRKLSGNPNPRGQ